MSTNQWGAPWLGSPNPGSPLEVAHEAPVVLIAALALVSCLVSSLRTRGAEGEELVPNDKCLECHGQNDLTKTNAAGRTISLFIDEAVMKGSVHATNSCISCHRDLAEPGSIRTTTTWLSR